MTTAPTTDPKPTGLPKTEPRVAFPDLGTLVAAMDKARADGDEALRAAYNPKFERSQAHYNGWSTHIPLLASVIATARPGPVLEIGVGRGSSPMLVEMCRAMGRELVGIDQDAGWLDEIRDLSYPRLVHMPNWDALPAWLRNEDPHKHWAVIFIDHGPGEARLPVLKMCKGWAEFIVCHDTFNPGYLVGMDDFLATFEYRSDYTLMTSCTSVVSDVRKYAGAR